MKNKSQGKAVELTVNSKEENPWLLSGFIPRIRPQYLQKDLGFSVGGRIASKVKYSWNLDEQYDKGNRSQR